MNRKLKCIESLSPPAISPGSIKREGSYYRNLKNSELAKRYEKDNADPPLYGFKVKPKDWRWLDSEGQIGLSVNLCDCIKTPICSILIHHAPQQFAHVVEIDIRKLSEAIASVIIAQYDPTSENACHFNLVPEDAELDHVVMALKDLLSKEFPPGRLPQTQEERELALNAAAHYSQIYRIYRNENRPPQIEREPIGVSGSGERQLT